MKKLVACAALAVAVFLTGSSSPVFAHHGGNINWIQDDFVGPVTVVATKFNFTFTHPTFEGDLKDTNGKVQAWTFVLRPTPTGLRDRGWTRRSIKPGDTLTITYNPHKTAMLVGVARRLLINGKYLQIEPDDVQ
jgi:hypothetical protein